MKRIRLWIADRLRTIQLWIAPKYWRCSYCGEVRWYEEEVLCWVCNKNAICDYGEMIYKGD